MDNNLGDWLYYIVILIAAGISFMSSLKKKQRQAASQPEEIEEMEEVLPSVPPVWERQEKKTPPPVPEPRRQRLATVGETLRMTSSELSPVTEEQAAGWADELHLTDTDAMRKAVICAEILNRKY